MKALTTLVATLLLGVALLAGAAPASSEPVPEPPVEADPPAAYRHYVACGLSQNAKPAHHCSKKRKKGAFFRSNLGDVFYTVCVKFPTGKNLCAPRQEAVQGTLYVNKVTTNIPGMHKVTWFVAGKRVGLYFFDVTG
jgi:hypothetical protein